MTGRRYVPCPACTGLGFEERWHERGGVRILDVVRCAACEHSGWVERPASRPFVDIALIGLSLMAIVALLAVLAAVVPEPRSTPDPTASRPGTATTGSVGVSARVEESASGPASSGASVPAGVSHPSLPEAILGSRGSVRTIGTLGPRSGSVPATDPCCLVAPIEATHVVRGWATVDAGQARGHAAAGPALRRAMGGDPAFRGATVTVIKTVGGRERRLVVTLTDWCACGDRHGADTVIDLNPTDYGDLTGRDPGIAWVRIVLDDGRSIRLPATDTQE